MISTTNPGQSVAPKRLADRASEVFSMITKSGSEGDNRAATIKRSTIYLTILSLPISRNADNLFNCAICINSWKWGNSVYHSLTLVGRSEEKLLWDLSNLLSDNVLFLEMFPYVPICTSKFISRPIKIHSRVCTCLRLSVSFQETCNSINSKVMN